MSMVDIKHGFVTARGVRHHVTEAGSGPPLVRPASFHQMHYAAALATSSRPHPVIARLWTELRRSWMRGSMRRRLHRSIAHLWALFRLIRRELNNQGFDGVVTEEVIRQVKKAEEILKQIAEDDDVSVCCRSGRSCHPHLRP